MPNGLSDRHPNRIGYLCAAEFREYYPSSTQVITGKVNHEGGISLDRGESNGERDVRL